MMLQYESEIGHLYEHEGNIRYSSLYEDEDDNGALQTYVSDDNEIYNKEQLELYVSYLKKQLELAEKWKPLTQPNVTE